MDSEPTIVDLAKKATALRFHLPHSSLLSVFGNDWFALRAEGFARFFGTPIFITIQTIVVVIWVSLNVVGIFKFDVYPFILLNLAFSLQAAYAAPLILLAQTRQADRDKVLSEADAEHREDLAVAAEDRARLHQEHSLQLLELLTLNTELTRTTHELSQRIERLTFEMNKRMIVTN